MAEETKDETLRLLSLVNNELMEGTETVIEALVNSGIGRSRFERAIKKYAGDPDVADMVDIVNTVQERNLIIAGKDAEKSSGFFYQFLLKNWCGFKHQGKEDDGDQFAVDMEIKKRIAAKMQESEDNTVTSLFDALREDHE